jgi:hypothetical protein
MPVVEMLIRRGLGVGIGIGEGGQEGRRDLFAKRPAGQIVLFLDSDGC